MDEGIRRGRDIHNKSILCRFLHIPKSSVNKSSRVTVAAIFFNEEISIIGFPSGRRAWHNRCRNLTFPSDPSCIANPSSITGVAGNYAWPSGEVFRDYKYLYAEIYFVPGNFFNLPNIPFSVP